VTLHLAAQHTCFLFFSTSLDRFDNSSLISFRRRAKRSLFSAMISWILMDDCHALTNVLDYSIRKLLRGREQLFHTYPAFPSLVAYVSVVARANFCKPFPYSSSSVARFLKNMEASCGMKQLGCSSWRATQAAGTHLPCTIPCFV
jgi:hypothetical protein